MFGYVRPLKSDLLVKEFSYYRAVYCGLCKQIGREYGQAARLTLGYDLTMLAVLLLSLSDEPREIRPETCVLNPIRKKPVMQEHTILSACAALSVILVWYKASDDTSDGKRWQGNAVHLALRSAYEKAAGHFETLIPRIETELRTLADIEAGPPDLRAAECFGRLLGEIFSAAVQTVFSPDHPARQRPMIDAISLIGHDLGCWIYLVDAIDDWQEDTDNGRWNPLGGRSRTEACAQASERLEQLERSLDLTAALLPYQQDSGIIRNIIIDGLPDMRRQIIAGTKPGRL